MNGVVHENGASNTSCAKLEISYSEYNSAASGQETHSLTAALSEALSRIFGRMRATGLNALALLWKICLAAFQEDSINSALQD